MIGGLLLPLVLLAAPAALDQLAASRPADLAGFDAGLTAADPAVRAAAVRALGRLQREDALPRLEKALDDPEHPVRLAAAFAWGQIESAPAKPLVDRVQKESAPPVRVALTQALGKLAKTDVPHLLQAADEDADYDVRAAARISLALAARRADGVVPGLAQRLSDWLRDPDERLRYAGAYATLRATKVTALVRDALLRCAKREPKPLIRALCTRSLGRYETKPVESAKGPGTAVDREVFKVLIERTRDDDWRVAVEAWRAAGQAKLLNYMKGAYRALGKAYAASPARAAGPRLHAWTAGLDAALAAAAGAEGRVTTGIAQLLHRKPPKDERPQIALGRAHIRCRAAALLDQADGGERLKDCHKDAPKTLIEALTIAVLKARPPDKRAAAVVQRWATAKTASERGPLLDVAAELKGQDGLEPVIAAGIQDADPRVAGQAAAAAAALEFKALAPALRERLSKMTTPADLEGQLMVVEALGKLKDAAAKDALRPLLTAPNVTVAEAAAKALQALGEDAKAQPQARQSAPPTTTAKTATIKTTKGPFKMTLHAADAPYNVANFVTLAEKDFFDGLAFHRVVGDFVVQGGDPRGDGWGGPGYTVPCEINTQPYTTGAVGVALAGKDTGGSQWFVTHSPQPHLDGRYTVFGQVTRGQDVIDALAVGDKILDVTIER